MKKMFKRIKVWWLEYDPEALQNFKRVNREYSAIFAEYEKDNSLANALKLLPAIQQILELPYTGLPIEIQLILSRIKISAIFMTDSVERLLHVNNQLEAVRKLQEHLNDYADGVGRLE
jgi:hypothetical protein